MLSSIRLFPRIPPKPRRTKVPYPPESFKVSVVIMNHDRPYLLKQTGLLPVLTSHPSVSQVILLHSNNATAFTSEELDKEKINISKIIHVDAIDKNEEFGLAIRFQYCATDAPTEWVMMVDDDMVVDPAAISTMMWSMIEDERRIVGHYGREYNWLARHHGYEPKDRFGKVEVVLTKTMILEKKMCEQFVEHMNIVHDLVVDSQPKWNGEDIFVNLVTNHYYNVRGRDYHNLAIEDLPVWDVDTSKFAERHSINGDLDKTRILEVGLRGFLKALLQADTHLSYRGKLWYTAKQRLRALGRTNGNNSLPVQ